MALLHWSQYHRAGEVGKCHNRNVRETAWDFVFLKRAKWSINRSLDAFQWLSGSAILSLIMDTLVKVIKHSSNWKCLFYSRSENLLNYDYYLLPAFACIFWFMNVFHLCCHLNWIKLERWLPILDHFEIMYFVFIRWCLITSIKLVQVGVWYF